jgi:hypothetical protein
VNAPSLPNPAPPPDTSLDHWLPTYLVREHHQRLIRAPAEATLKATLALPVAPDRIVRSLFFLRGLGAGGKTIAEFASSDGFVTLERTATTLVFGLAGGFRHGWQVARTREEWIAWSAPGLKIVGDFRAHPTGNGHTRLTTETRVQPLNRASHLGFRLYWLLVGPFSALIRRRWLRAIARAAEGT